MNLMIYGEDGLTLWAMENRLDVLLSEAEDDTQPERCTIFYRPSFGRRGGKNSSQFGEFDFIVLAQNRLYLGESKWNWSSKPSIDEGQKSRHDVLRRYVATWFDEGKPREWNQAFEDALRTNLQGKPLPGSGTLLRKNLTSFLDAIGKHFSDKPEIVNTLLVLWQETKPRKASIPGFLVVLVECPRDLGYFVALKGSAKRP